MVGREAWIGAGVRDSPGERKGAVAGAGVGGFAVAVAGLLGGREG